MENVLQYLKWRGDILFSERSFNENDALICGLLGYIEWDNIVQDDKILLRDACQKNLEIHTHEEMALTYAYSPMLIELMETLPSAARYKNVVLKRYESILDEDEGGQFSAVTIELDNHTYFISYRGTDSTILGWKEDFEMTFLDMIPSQQMALNYLQKIYNEMIPKKKRLFRNSQTPTIYLGGHSKGGNLAMYAAICCEEMKPYITHVYSFDGPGFREDFYKNHEYHSIIERIYNYAPMSSLIGRLMIHKEKYVIFKAYDNGLQQHDGFYWKVTAENFDYVDKFDAESDKTIQYINDVLLSKTDAEKKTFISLIFKILNDIKISEITDFNEISLTQAYNGLKELKSLSLEDSKMLLEFLKLIVLQVKSVYFTKKKEI